MTKKDYILIADVIANRFSTVDGWDREGVRTRTDEQRHTLTEIVTFTEDFVRVLKADNPDFDRTKFIRYINEKRTDSGKLV